MNNLLKKHKLVLMEAAIVERLRRSMSVQLHPSLVHAPLIYDQESKQALQKLYVEYIDVALNANVPFLMYTPTWRTNRSRVLETGGYRSINDDAVRFMRQIRETHRPGEGLIRIGGMIGCKNDCYNPSEGLSSSESEEFHTWQIDQLAQADVDYLIAATLPNIEEAIGIARAMEKTGLPYIISFVISRDGCVLDGTDLISAINRIDSSTDKKPLGFMANCSYPSFVCAARQPDSFFERFIGCQANASALDHFDLDGSDQVKAESVSAWSEEMLMLNQSYGVKILGGCCGTSAEHLRYLVDHRIG
jgi:S-methylmethionine-dependent homocysteine/selenocysteine methylase